MAKENHSENVEINLKIIPISYILSHLGPLNYKLCSLCCYWYCKKKNPSSNKDYIWGTLLFWIYCVCKQGWLLVRVEKTFHRILVKFDTCQYF